MFYERFEKLCREHGYTPSGAVLAIGRSKNLAAKWKNTGATPSAEVLNQLSDFFDVSTDYLLGKEADNGENDSIVARQDVLDRPEMRILFDAAKDAPSSAILEAALGLMKLKETNQD